ncbi:hypothetical protein FIBSPDRAFT_828938 [Athelia psychrophila]|uniref:DUF6533 domain-containing protein n=1 Tax=Athelia psychrophila TaxID=1759441 RepID=A0A166HB56_9AGAM|nr:hypothetical protein FIBSPDRAFT_828938 [Fibularhizoctonia sp. CBS 109695]
MENAFDDAYGTKWLSAAGTTVLLYDHLLTLPCEIKLIWRSPSSFQKWAFLFNRYLVPIAQISVATEMSGFFSGQYSDFGCRVLLGTTAMLAVTSIGIANILVLMRVVMLWDGNLMVKWLMCCGFVVSFCTTCSLMVATLFNLIGGIVYSPIVGMCITTTNTKYLVAVWASPMLFELLVLAATGWNLFARPRTANLKITRALHKDGISYFVILTVLRAFNVCLAIRGKPATTMLAVFFVWSATTLVVNRALLHVRHVEVREAYIAQHAHLLESRTVTPSGSTPDIDELEDWQLEEQLQERDEGSETLGRDTPLQAELKNFLTWSSRDKSLESKWF